MISISENFQNLSKLAGRSVYCKIIAGELTFLDDKIIECDFDDIVHPDFFTVGTACANRFAFTVKYEDEIAVNAEVRPYFSFDGEEWCPLGVFYVSRRYIRGNYASITSYDRMYSLDTEYSSSLNLPTTTADLAREICSNYEITCEDYGTSRTVTEIPTDCTVKDMLGYIAMMNNCCAKFDRYGALTFRLPETILFFFSSKNCMDCSVNMSRSIIRHVTVDTGETVLEKGDGGTLTSLELYNPMMTENAISSLYSHLLLVNFYGAEIEMQGMPFIESGDYVLFVDGEDVYTIVCSEIDYHYDGALTAKLYSRNRNNTDPTVHQTDLESAIEDLKISLGTIYSKQTNDEALSLSAEEQTVTEFNFVTKKANVFAQVDLNFTVDGGGSNRLVIAVYVNGEKLRESVHEVNGSSRELIHFYCLAENLPKGNNTISVTMQTASGTMVIRSGQLIATLIGKGTAGGTQNYRDRQTIFDELDTIALEFSCLAILGIDDEIESDLTEQENDSEETET